LTASIYARSTPNCFKEFNPPWGIVQTEAIISRRYRAVVRIAVAAYIGEAQSQVRVRAHALDMMHLCGLSIAVWPCADGMISQIGIAKLAPVGAITTALGRRSLAIEVRLSIGLSLLAALATWMMNGRAMWQCYLDAKQSRGNCLGLGALLRGWRRILATSGDPLF
jgi:hypothetical protein